MTYEEMAEEYCNEMMCTVCSNIICGYKGKCTEWETRKQAFLAGLKAGRPQWHDLEKEPTDLPKDNIPVLVIIDYLALGKEYAIRENLKDDYKGVIAWKEIVLPELKESE